MPYHINIDTQSTALNQALRQQGNLFSPLQNFPQLVLGDERPYRIRFFDGVDPVEWNGNEDYQIQVGIGTCAAPVEGTFTFTFDGQTTAPLAVDSTSQDIQAALEGLSSIGSGNIRVTGGNGLWRVEFIGDLAEAQHPNILGDSTLAVPDSRMFAVEIQEGGAGVNEVQAIQIQQTLLSYQDVWSPYEIKDAEDNVIESGFESTLSTASLELAMRIQEADGINSTIEIKVIDPNGRHRTYVKQAVRILCRIINVAAFIPSPMPEVPTVAQMQSYVTDQIDDLREEMGEELEDKADLDLGNVNPVIGRSALGLGNSATRYVGTAAAQVAAGNDARFPTAGEKAALAGSGTPGAGNLYVTQNTLTSGLATKVNSTEKGANNGVATLDAGGKVPATQLPNSVMEYHGNWNATTNTPALANGTGNAGDTYRCSVAGSVNFGAGAITFNVGDFVIYSGSIWERSINSNEVVSVNGKKGVVTGLVESVGGQVPDSNGAIATIPMDKVALIVTPHNSYRVLTSLPSSNHFGGVMSVHASSLSAEVIPMRGAGGFLTVREAPTRDNEATSKKYVDAQVSTLEGKVVKSVGGEVPDGDGAINSLPVEALEAPNAGTAVNLMGWSNTGAPVSQSTGSSPAPFRVARYDGNSGLGVQQPIETYHATPKSYVDTQHREGGYEIVTLGSGTTNLSSSHKGRGRIVTSSTACTYHIPLDPPGMVAGDVINLMATQSEAITVTRASGVGMFYDTRMGSGSAPVVGNAFAAQKGELIYIGSNQWRLV